MSKTTHTPNFKPWISNLIMAFYGAIAVWFAFHFLLQRGYTGSFVVALTVCGGFTYYQWDQFSKRTYGQRVERLAIKDLLKEIGRVNGAAMDASVALRSGGDADAVVTIYGKKFNVEIKSIESHKKVTAKHAAQARRAGSDLSSTPIIWLPRAKINANNAVKDVDVCAGNAKCLVKLMDSIS